MNKKYDFDIDKLKDTYNQGILSGRNMSINKVAEKLGWCKVATHQWYKRKYFKLIDFKEK